MAGHGGGRVHERLGGSGEGGGGMWGSRRMGGGEEGSGGRAGVCSAAQGGASRERFIKNGKPTNVRRGGPEGRGRGSPDH